MTGSDLEAYQLIGKVGAQALGRLLREGEQSDSQSTARFLLDRLKPEQIIHICAEIYHRSDLSADFEIHMPQSLVSEDLLKAHGLPLAILSEEPATAWRNAECSKQALLVANTAEDQGQSLKELTTINASTLMSYIDIWCQLATEGLPLTQQHFEYWKKALSALEQSVSCSLMQFARYVLNTRASLIATEGQSVIDALGWALPALSIPRDSGYFRTISPAKRGHKSEWQRCFQQAKQQRACFLEKQTPKREIIDDEELRQRYNDNKALFSPTAQAAIESFLVAQPGWSPASTVLAELEWENEYIHTLFVIKKEKQNLAQATLEFFADEMPDILTAAEVHYLEQLKRRKTKEAFEQDREFYEVHRENLNHKPSLKAKWDKFIYGQPIECTDFMTGLLLAFSRLLTQSNAKQGTKRLHIRTQKTGARSKWLELNTDAGLYFEKRYAGLPSLMGASVTWDTHHLFTFASFIQEQKERGKVKKKAYKRNTSFAKAANEIKFVVELTYQIGGSERKEDLQLIWRFNPNVIAAKLSSDLNRLREKPFLSKQIYLEPVSQKGSLQSLSLLDTGTLQATYSQERGTLIPVYQPDHDQQRLFEAALEQHRDNLSDIGYEAIQSAWERFKQQYAQALQSWGDNGVCQNILIEQAREYKELLTVLMAFAANDTARQALWEPLFKIGHLQVADTPLAIIAPWHPLRLAALLIKDRQVANLLKKLLSTEPFDFSDPDLYFQERIQELAHPYYPEISAYLLSSPHQLLVATETHYDYSLMEPPVSALDTEDVYEDPLEASKRIKEVVGRYLELLPHEQSSLDLVLYQCDQALLPQLAIKLLSEAYTDSNVICQIMLRHRNRKKLAALYRNLIESTREDEGSIITSEHSLDFMSRFRIGILSESLPTRPHFGKPVDIVFLQDVISRQAQLRWLPFTPSQDLPDFEQHVPPRWSKRKPSKKGEKHGTQYLLCPLQPEEGSTYLQAIEYLTERTQHEGFHVPVRQIYLEDTHIQETLEEVHRLGEWVVNYDDLLDRRQLRNLGLQVIRFQQRRTQGRNLLISSDASLSLLQVLVKRRLEELSLPMAADLGSLVTKLIEDANLISGDLVLRAAKRGIFSKELLGVVMSFALLRSEIGAEQPFGVYFLDDYANWLGQKEQRIADLMVLNPRGQGKERQLHILISEAKYVDASNADSAAKSSQNQLRDTLARINRALFSEPVCIDRELWLARLGELLLEGLGSQPDGLDFSAEAESWRTDLMRGQIPIQIHGYSHVFISGPLHSGVESQQLPVKHAERALQEIFNRESVQRILCAYAEDNHTALIELRKSLGIRKSFETLKQLPVQQVNVVSQDSIAVEPLTAALIQEEQSEAPLVQQREASGLDAFKTCDKPQHTVSPKPIEGQKLWPPQFLSDWLQAEQSVSQEDQRLAEDTAQNLRSALYSYELPAKVLATQLTPNAIVVQLQGSDALTLQDIEKRRSQLLTTHALNILYVTALPGVLVVAVERSQRQSISLVDTWLRRKANYDKTMMNMSLLIGVKELDGELLYLNFNSSFEGLEQHAPHTLIAGATGSGKSVLLQNLILDIAATNSPSIAQIHLIDPKGVDYLALESLPHLGSGIIYEQEEASQLLFSLVEEMENRYRLFRAQRVAKLSDYNQKAPSEERLPAIWLIHDEFADWMMVDSYKDAVTQAVQRLGVKARAAGIHLIFAAQRPDANVLPPQLRDNLGNRLILKVESTGTSRIALGQDGAEKLLGKGHLAARLSGEPNLIFAQVPFLTDRQIQAVVEKIAVHSVGV